MQKEERFTIPNFITFSRVLLLVAMWIFFFLKDTFVLGILFLIAGVTDLLDGFLARKLNQETEFGAKFDSAADNLLGFSFILWLPFLFPDIIAAHGKLIGIAVFFVAFSWLVAALKFKRNPEFHLTSNKVATVIIYAFVAHALFFGYNTVFLYVTLAAAVVMAVEELAITFTHKDISADMKKFKK